MEWFEEFGFDENPFWTNPLKTNFNLIGRENESKEILYRIASGSMLLIEGKPGTGKTALLKYAIDNFKGKGKVVYVNGNKLNKRLDVSDLVRKKPQGMILLLDNVQNLSKSNNQKIKYYYDEDRIKSAVFTTTDYSLVNFTDAIKERIGENVIRLKDLSYTNASKIAKERLNEKDILPDEVLKELYLSSGNVKEFLDNCGFLCSYVAKKGKEKAEPDDLKKFQKINLEVEAYEETNECPECSKPLVQVNESWRCKNCDQYCGDCGALIDNEDESCPRCGIEIEVDKE